LRNAAGGLAILAGIAAPVRVDLRSMEPHPGPLVVQPVSTA
jgi:hypothetical protein